MFGILLTAVLAVGAEGHEATLPATWAEAPSRTGLVITDSHIGFNVGNSGALDCNCIRSSSSYAWRWFGPDKRGGCTLPCRRSCPTYYGLYRGAYDFRRAYDYSWRSKTYRPRNISSRCAECNRDRLSK